MEVLSAHSFFSYGGFLQFWTATTHSHRAVVCSKQKSMLRNGRLQLSGDEFEWVCIDDCNEYYNDNNHQIEEDYSVSSVRAVVS